MKRALLVIDVQNDFCPGGALAVPDGHAIVPACNALIRAAELVVLTQDWHPRGHGSFASTHGAAPFSTTTLPYGEQVLWPDHCVQGSEGAAFHPDLDTVPARYVLRKGTDPAVDSYSAFFENDRTTDTGLAGLLRGLDVEGVDLCGLAADYCVRYSALDACRLGFDVAVHTEATRGIDPAGTQAAWDELQAAGARLIR